MTNADSSLPLTTFQYHFSNTANTWDDVRGPNNEKLKIGCVMLQYARNASRNGKNTCNEEETKFVDGGKLSGELWDKLNDGKLERASKKRRMPYNIACF